MLDRWSCAGELSGSLSHQAKLGVKPLELAVQVSESVFVLDDLLAERAAVAGAAQRGHAVEYSRRLVELSRRLRALFLEDASSVCECAYLPAEQGAVAGAACAAVHRGGVEGERFCRGAGECVG